MEVIERLEIPCCPICGSKHIYKLTFKKITVFYDTKAIFRKNILEDKPQLVRFTLILVCPVKNEKFQASLKLYQEPSSKIESVKIKGVIEDEAQ